MQLLLFLWTRPPIPSGGVDKTVRFFDMSGIRTGLSGACNLAPERGALSEALAGPAQTP